MPSNHGSTKQPGLPEKLNDHELTDHAAIQGLVLGNGDISENIQTFHTDEIVG